MAEYARREGFGADAAYRWRRVLRRTEQSVQKDDAPAVSKIAPAKQRRGPAVRFARVVVNDTQQTWASMMLHLVLTNGRRAELEIGGIAQLGEMIGALERAA